MKVTFSFYTVAQLTTKQKAMKTLSHTRTPVKISLKAKSKKQPPLFVIRKSPLTSMEERVATWQKGERKCGMVFGHFKTKAAVVSHLKYLLVSYLKQHYRPLMPSSQIIVYVTPCLADIVMVVLPKARAASLFLIFNETWVIT